MAELPSFSIELERTHDFQFIVKFDSPNFPDLLLDEPEPLGNGQGPNASRILAAAVSNCLSASLLFCLSKAKLDSGHMKTRATVQLKRDEKKRLRLGHIDVNIMLENPDADAQRYQRCANLFEDFCVVTESVRNGIPVDVHVSLNGQKLLTVSE